MATNMDLMKKIIHYTFVEKSSDMRCCNMKIGYLEVKLGAPWVHSLKEKRMIVRSIIAKVRQQDKLKRPDKQIGEARKRIKNHKGGGLFDK